MKDRILTARDAEGFGFNIEGNVCFLYTLGAHFYAILGWDSMNEAWRLDTQINDDGDFWSSLNEKLGEAIDEAESIEALCQNASALGVKDIVEFLNVVKPSH